MFLIIMFSATYKTVLLILLLITGVWNVCAQTRAAGASFSFSGLGVSYEESPAEGTFYEFGLKAELGEVLTDRTDCPGVSASFTCNYIISRWQSANHNEIILYAGPGIETGWIKDFHRERGLFIGLKGRVGLRCMFPRRIIVSVSLAPCFGAHFISREYTGVRMEYYRYGLMNTVMPEIGIKYAF